MSEVAAGPAVARAGLPLLDPAVLRQLCLDLGADDVGFVDIDDPAIADQLTDIRAALPEARALISFVCRMARGNIRNPARSIANHEFHHVADKADDIASALVRRLEAMGIDATTGAPTGFPMEADRWPGKMWLISHKPVAVAAGLGRMGIHRNVIHPAFGSFILLGTVIIGRPVASYGAPIDFNPCLGCKLCVAACPTGAISADGHFDFAACFTHNYCEFMGGFGDWVETIAESGSARRYRAKVSEAETVSMWQSLSFGANYKAAYCLAVCPAGTEVITPYLADKGDFTRRHVKPLRDKAETIYVVKGSDAESYVSRVYPHKRPKRVGNGLRPATIAGFLSALPVVFQRGRAGDLNARYHFTFTAPQSLPILATITIAERQVRVERGHQGKADLQVTADQATWLGFLKKEKSLPLALLSRRVKLKGPPRLLLAFGRCFPS
jgi:ferredoxin